MAAAAADSGLDSRERAVARELAAWRERTAAAEDRPVGAVVRDPTVVELAKRQPRTRARAAADPRRRAGRRAPPRAGTSSPRSSAAGRRSRSGSTRASGSAPRPADGPTIALAEALVRARAHEAGLAYELIAARADLAPIVVAARRGRPEPDVRTLRGWRRELVGEELLELLAGRRRSASATGASVHGAADRPRRGVGRGEARALGVAAPRARRGTRGSGADRHRARARQRQPHLQPPPSQRADAAAVRARPPAARSRARGPSPGGSRAFEARKKRSKMCAQLLGRHAGTVVAHDELAARAAATSTVAAGRGVGAGVVEQVVDRAARGGPARRRRRRGRRSVANVDVRARAGARARRPRRRARRAARPRRRRAGWSPRASSIRSADQRGQLLGLVDDVGQQRAPLRGGRSGARRAAPRRSCAAP